MDITKIEDPKFLKSLNTAEMNALAEDIRRFLITNVSKTGGHLSSNLGVVELTMALHYVFDSPKDKIFFDVGHQSYIHKILTGRAPRFHTLRQWDGISGFQKRSESVHDVWEAGHSSTSLSAALGMAVTRDLNNESYHVVPVIGDGALASGMSLEALNQIGGLKKNMIIVFNDNNMSISQNVGAISNGLGKLRSSKPYNLIKHDTKELLSSTHVGKSVLGGLRSVKDMIKKSVVDPSIFTEFNLEYYGPVDGHDIKQLINVFEAAKSHDGPIVVHVLTKKGKGYKYCENDYEGYWHGVGSFDPETGHSLSETPGGHLSWSQIMSESLIKQAMSNKDVVAITPAMITGSKLERFFNQFPERSFDCGIAEEHAMTFAASLAVNGKKPFISVYSSFIQRAYDQINHDIARMDAPVVIGIDRAGLVGEDGDTHHGVFDVGILMPLPNIIISQPKDSIEAESLLHTAFNTNHPFVIRYPRGSAPYFDNNKNELIKIGTWTKEYEAENSKLVVLAYGPDVNRITQKAIINELPITVINARFFKPLDNVMLNEISNSNLPIICYETDMLKGGLSSSILEYYNDTKQNVNLIRIGIDDVFVTHGSVSNLRKSQHIDINSLFEKILSIVEA